MRTPQSRLHSYCNDRLLEELNRMVGELCRQAGADRGQIVDAVVVGNTAMHHFVAGLPVRQLVKPRTSRL